MRTKHMPEVSESASSTVAEDDHSPARSQAKTPALALRARTLLALPAAIALGFAIHYLVSTREPAPQTHAFSFFLGLVFLVTILCGALQRWSIHLRRWVGHM